ncbi:helix-turn-helix transcriptional regulator [Modestobacter lapidis]|nr:helix-turn-helix transcriptional regulator [Modestobacter lapidis]
MPFVLTVDQRASRRNPDRVAGTLSTLADVPTLLRFERTAGDEFQGVLDDPAVVVAVVLDLVRAGGWSIGVGAGPMQTPLPASTRAGAGAAFVAARAAVEAAKRRPARVAVRGAAPTAAGDAQAALTALAVLVQRRSEQAWEAIALVEAGRTQAEAAAELGVTRQAVGQRLAAGLWEVERDLRPATARLLARVLG